MHKQIAIKIMIGLLSLVVLFHICILAKIFPYNIAWGGRIENDEQMFLFETASIAINLFLLLILLMKGNLIKFRFGEKTINIILWAFFILFLLNTVGNLFANTNFEKMFAVLTLGFALLIWKILRKSKTKSG